MELVDIIDKHEDLSIELYYALLDRLESFEDNLAIDIMSDVPEYDADYIAEQPSKQVIRAREAYIDALVSEFLAEVY